jgi:predicted Zn finger-like uncharacterized protein
MPVLAVCDGCRTEYRVKDGHAGAKVKCRECGAVFVVPRPAVEAAPRLPGGPGAVGPFGYDRFLINQKRISISEKYYVHDEDKNPILFVERPAHFWRSLGALMAALFVAIGGTLAFLMVGLAFDRPETKALSGLIILTGVFASIAAAIAVTVWLIPKRHIYVYTDDTKSRLLLEVFQDKKISFIRATYTVRDPQEGLLGRLRKNYLYNLFRKRWDAFRPDGSPLVVAREDSLILSLLRRLFGPMLGLLRTNFVILRPDSGTVLGEFNRKMTLFDRYVLDLTADRARELDRRMAVALGVLLDTGERR